MPRLEKWMTLSLIAVAALPARADEAAAGEVRSANTPMVIEGGAEAPNLSSVPLPPADFSRGNRVANARLAAQRLEAMLGDVEILTGIPEAGLDLPLVFPDEGQFPSHLKTRYSE